MSDAIRYRIVFKKSAKKELDRCETMMRLRILQALEHLKTVPLPRGVKKLSDREDVWRLRVGDHRVLYKIIGSELVIFVIKIGSRRDVCQ